MNTADFEAKLIGLRQQLSDRLGRVEDHIKRHDGPLSADFGEQATERQNDEVVFALDDSLKDELRAIDAALHRITNGEFGTCVRCGEEIEATRLDAVPFAATCVGCKEPA
ncbi:MAG TPA: TraR/DksA C4-type zinc finger protein [Gammaproteobacteria bacterium]|nr:TraR/DksA C4-type zinc finger protein [Gammaproteobacteria bacterium]